MTNSNPLPRTSGRTTLRPFADSDLERFQACRTDPEVARYQSWEQMTDSEALQFIQSAGAAQFLVPGHWYQLVIANREKGFLIGDIGICVDDAEMAAEIGFSLDRRYQQQGLGREAVAEAIKLIFEQTPVERVTGITDKRNIKSIKLLTAVGMEITDTIDTIFRGEPCTELSFAILRQSLSDH